MTQAQTDEMAPALVFPGQGSQYVGMGASFAAHPAAKRLFEQADDILHSHLTKLMLDGDADTLALTQNTQPALLLVGVAALKILEDEKECAVQDIVSFVAGHSLGEYTALVAAGVLSFPDAITLVRKRGQAMQTASPSGAGKMAAVLGMSQDDVTALAHSAGVYIANDNAEGQVVLSGAAKNIENACLAAKDAGAKRAVELPVSAPFHSSLVAPAADEMAAAFKDVTFYAPQIPIVSNVCATCVHDAAAWPDLLTKQITATVRWRESMIYLAQAGVTSLLEMGSGKVLTGLAKRCDARLSGTALQTVDEIKNQREKR